MNVHVFSADTYRKRREVLAKKVKNGKIWILGNGEAPKNYTDNTYHFRQDSNFLYYAGIALPDLSLWMDLDSGNTYLCGDDRAIDLVVWMGPQTSMVELAEKVGITQVLTSAQLQQRISEAATGKYPIHYLPPYRGLSKIKISQWLNSPIHAVEQGASLSLIKAIIEQRSVKEEQELVEMEKALTITRDMHLEVIYETKEDLRECDLVARVMSIVHKKNVDTAYPSIITINGQTLHNHEYGNKLKNGQLLLGDFGAESPMHYAGDITRTLPVSGTFSDLQRSIYQIVLDGQQTAIDRLAPGIAYRDIHLATARKMAEGLVEIGLMRGDVETAVDEGAHALFFPHGLGHMIGLDVHDMEDLGEEWHGYDDEIKRSTQFGLRSLRFGKKLGEGYVLTVEPGIYFIPQLIDRWAAEKKHIDFINYSQLEHLKTFGGIRIEDNFVITAEGKKLLGPPIPKEISDIEFLMSTNRAVF